jgi:hypothetical protein
MRTATTTTSSPAAVRQLTARDAHADGRSPHRLPWFAFWMTRQQSRRRRRAYFRPIHPSALDATLMPLINQIVTVRFAAIDRTGNALAGQRLYRIVGRRTLSSRFVRPEADFDFLE